MEDELAELEARLQRGLDALPAGTGAADELCARLKVEKARKARCLDNKCLLQALRARVHDDHAVLERATYPGRARSSESCW